MKLRPIAVSILVMLTFLTFSTPATGQPEEMNLEGIIFRWDDTPLEGLPWEDITPFAIWVYHNGTWNRFPKTGWVLTSGGWYAYTLEASERDVNWSNGDTYRVQIDATAFGGLNTNVTSHGTGDPGEFPPFGELENNIMWSDPDNTQQWDVVIPIPDLQPFAIAVDGIEYPGPYDPTVPIGPIVVLAGSPHAIEANVTNEGSPLIRILNTATLEDSCGTIVHMGEIQVIGAGSSAPPGSRFSSLWTAPVLPFVGSCLLNYTVDFYNNVTEYDEANNSATILFEVEGPDLTPSDVVVQAPSGTYFYNDTSTTLPPFHSDVIPANPGDNVIISLNATNVGGYGTGTQFNVVMIDTGNVSDGPPISVIYNSGEVGPLLAGSSTGPFVSNLQITNQTGYHCLNLTVDYGLDGSGNISEISETNNTFVVCFGVDVPDLTPYQIAIDLEDGSSFTYLDASVSGYVSDPIYVFPGNMINITASVRNVGVFQSPVGVETQLSFYLVGDSPMNPLEGKIAEWSNVPPLSPGSVAGPFAFVGYAVPFVLGDQYINVTVDNRSQVQEASEMNNTFTIHLVVGGSDIIPSRLNLTVDGLTTQYTYPESPTVEVDITSIVQIEAVLENQGNFGTNGTFLTEFLDNSVAFHWNVSGPLGPNESMTTNSSWANPGVPSSHTIAIIADSANDIVEINETNNVFTLTIIVKGADLIPSNVTIDVGGRIAQYQYSDSPVGPVIVDISEDVHLNVTIHNQGGYTAGVFSMGFVVDGLLFNLSRPMGPLDPSFSVLLTDISWPNPLLLGSYFVAIHIDYLGNVSEVDEDNNEFDILFRLVGPDIVALDFLVNDVPYTGPVAVTGGDTLLLTGVAYNAGTNVTPSSFYVSIYNSSERISPLLLVNVVPLEPGAYQWFNVSWHAPMDYLSVGVTFEVDFYDDILETDETNNLFEASLVVTPLPPDLQAVNPEINGLPYEGPYQALAGDVITFSAFVRNIGNYTTGGPFDNAFYNETMAYNPFTRRVEGALIRGSMTGEIEATWHAPRKIGIYVVVFHADYVDWISEANESNNNLTFVVEVLGEEEEYNWKPLLALLFALILVLLGILAGYLRPLDRFVPMPKDMPDEERKSYRKQIRGLPVGEKLKALDRDSLLRKFARDRLFTIAVLALPLSLAEVIIAILSFLTGVLRVPEAGNWITVGLIANLIILIAGVSMDILASKKGYRVPTEVLEPPPPEDD
ncbi:MAG: CARDB domain-containing protein [Thermoplasmata archaeon]